MRISKDAAERRSEILDAAEVLFNERGFDGTSTNDIMNKVGIARGTLYYHFESKERIMDGIIARYNQRITAQIHAAVNQQQPVLDRLLQGILAMTISDVSEGVMEHIHKPQNALMHQKIQQTLINTVTPILAGIAEEGVRTGLFHTPFPYESMEMLLIYGLTVFDGDFIELTEEEMLKRMQAFAFNVERLYGVESGVVANRLMEILMGNKGENNVHTNDS